MDDAVLIIWSGSDPGTRSTGRTLAGLLEAEPHRLSVVQADLTEAAAGRSLLQSLVSRVGGRLEAAMLASQSWQALEPQFKERPPRLVVALDALAGAVVDAWRGKGLVRAPLCGISCGLRLDTDWARTAVDRLSVADAVQAEAAAALGLPAEILVPCGIPVCGGFSAVSAEEKEAHRRRFGLAPERPVVLVVSHGMGDDTLTGALFQLSMIAEKATLLFDVARDDDAPDLLRRRAGLYEISAEMFGKVEEAAQLWAASDIVVARPHLYVEQRALALRLPLIAVLPESAEERETAAAWSVRRIGRSVDHLSTLAAEIDLQLAPAALQGARATMGDISRRNAATELARFIAQARAQSEQLLAEAHQRVVKLAETIPPAAPAGPPKGPLEPIGVRRDEAAPAATESLADIEAAEAEANRQVTEHQQEVERWARRASLAADKGESELRATAERELERHQAAMHRSLAELARLSERRQRASSPSSTAPGSTGRVDGAFRKLEVEEALEALKRKLE